jgi:putative peptidoglycan lipid II flippase
MLKLLKTKTNTIGKTALLLTFFTITSSILAVVRDKIFSAKFGAGEILDTYLAAFKIPDIVFLLTATLISAFVIIPLFEKEEKKSSLNLQIFIDKLFSTFALFILIVAFLVFLLTPFLAKTFFAGFSPDQLETLIDYSRIMLLSPIFMGLSFVFMGLNQKNSYFFPVALTGVFYNLSIIFGTLVLYPIFGF